MGFYPVAVYYSPDRLSLCRLRTDHIENASHSFSVLLHAVPSDELFTKNLSSRELVY
jgi:hypothetical protein